MNILKALFCLSIIIGLAGCAGGPVYYSETYYSDAPYYVAPEPVYYYNYGSFNYPAYYNQGFNNGVLYDTAIIY